ncbi:hypothetical protein [Limnohabitans sp. DM1]|uniref:hypothetical protein n=1 Tax=Limnohabitans sp. DM1 TaxID=1597955 RepID=UPI001892C5D4|nr:hypothetical protein [Limnohabitans sp. DM1]
MKTMNACTGLPRCARNNKSEQKTKKMPSSRGTAFSREERSDVAGRGDSATAPAQALDCRAPLAMTRLELDCCATLQPNLLIRHTEV